MRNDVNARLDGHVGERTLAARRERGDVARAMDLPRTDRGRNLHDLVDPVAPAGHESAPEFAQRVVEIGEGLEQEAGPVRPVEPTAQNRVVEHEEGNDAVGTPKRGRERGLIVDAEVAREDDDGRGHGGIIAWRRGSRRAASRPGRRPGPAS